MPTPQLLLIPFLFCSALAAQTAKLAQGPLIGHVDAHSARVWARSEVADDYVLTARNTATPGKQDHWGSYPHERAAPFDVIGKHKIGGVVLVGGDIHRSRVVRHDAKESAGYDILERIASPMHHSIIASANAPHPGLLKDMGEPHTFLRLEANLRGGKLRSLRARFVNADGKEYFAIDLLK